MLLRFYASARTVLLRARGKQLTASPDPHEENQHQASIACKHIMLFVSTEMHNQVRPIKYSQRNEERTLRVEELHSSAS
jgi:hypothetical protein